MVSELISKYIWLLQTIAASGNAGLTFPQIGRAWQRRWDSVLTRHSFYNHRNAIEEVFGIEISLRRSDNSYFVNGDFADTEASNRWLIDTYTIKGLLAQSGEKLKGRISVEAVPSGHKYLTPIIDAMLEGREVRMSYRKYGADADEKLTARPYSLREYAKRWYLVAFSIDKNDLRVYSLDRVRSLVKTEQSFVMPEDFDAEGLFYKSFGIYLPGERRAESIRLRAEGKEAAYMRDLPLHHTQKEEGEGEFSFRAVVDESLIMEMCRLSGKVEVLEPPSLRSELEKRLKKALEQYEGKNRQ